MLTTEQADHFRTFGFTVLRGYLADRADALRAERRRVLGIFTARSWPAADPSRKAGVRQQVTQALAGTAAPDERTAALIALLHALKCEHKVVDARSCQLSRSPDAGDAK
jgi:hypothetical protein